MQIEARVGNEIALDDGAQYPLNPCDDWDKAEFRIPVSGGFLNVAVNVEVTGRKVLRVGAYAEKIRCRVEFVGDVGEESVYRSGELIRYL